MDTNGDGKLSYDEFITGVKKYNLGLSNDQIYDLMRTIDINQNNSIDFEEFLNRFQVVFKKLKDLKEEEEWLKSAVKKIGDLLYRKRLTVLEAFKNFDKDNSGGISYEEFDKALSMLGLQFTPEQRVKIAKFVDTNDSKNISFKEFEKAFRVVDVKSQGTWENELIQKFCSLFYINRISLQAAFESLDLDSSGKIDVQEFKAGLQALNLLLEYPLSDMQISELHKLIDKDGDGTIDYEEFLHSFEVVDMLVAGTPKSGTRKK